MHQEKKKNTFSLPAVQVLHNPVQGTGALHKRFKKFQKQQ
jgi:hypothetical protein